MKRRNTSTIIDNKSLFLFDFIGIFSYNIMIGSSNVDMSKVPVNIPINFTATIQKVPTTSSYFSSVELQYGHGSQKVFIKFTGVHIPW